MGASEVVRFAESQRVSVPSVSPGPKGLLVQGQEVLGCKLQGGRGAEGGALLV